MDEKKQYIITYITTNLINGKQYIGSHATNKLNDGYGGSGVMLLKAIRKHGKVNFRTDVLGFHQTREGAYSEEGRYINKYNTNYPVGYNLSPTGGLACNGCHSKHTRKNMSLIQLRRHENGTVGWNKGLTKKTSKIVKQMGETQQGRILSKESRLKIASTARKNKTNLNKTPRKPFFHPTLRRGIKQYDLKGNYIRSWGSCKEAAPHIGVSASTIWSCVSGRTKTSGGFKWEGERPITYIIKQLTLNGELVATYKTQRAAAIAVDRNPSTISDAIIGNTPTCAGYKWIKVEADANN